MVNQTVVTEKLTDVLSFDQRVAFRMAFSTRRDLLIDGWRECAVAGRLDLMENWAGWIQECNDAQIVIKNAQVVVGQEVR